MTKDIREIMSARQPCAEGHALAIARWEDNREDWLQGKFFGLASKTPDLQEMVGNGGTLWIVISRRRSTGGRLYALSFRLDGCRKKMYGREGKFGKYAVEGDPQGSTLFASNDAKLLLLSLRFDPFRPIKSARVIGQSLEAPRCLNRDDIELLQDHALAADRWSVFISYQRVDVGIASRLSESLQRSGINVFRDQEALRGGQRWWPTVMHSIERSRHFVLLIGANTHQSDWVQRELRYAFEKGIRVIPLLAGGDLNAWQEFPELRELEVLSRSEGTWSSLVDRLVASVRLGG